LEARYFKDRLALATSPHGENPMPTPNTHLYNAWIAWLNALVPLVAVAGAYGLALYQGYDARCVPFVEGCTSISRAARYGDAIFLFRGLMMPLSMLLVIYWFMQWQWLNDLCDYKFLHKVILVLGCISALALILYANFLGSEGASYRFLRRFGVTFYFGFALLAQLLSIYALEQIRHTLSDKIQRGLRWQKMLITLQWILGLTSLAVTLTQPSYKDIAENMVEWNFALIMVLFYGVSGFMWKGASLCRKRHELN
jgi:hypothetical protein